MEWVVFGAGAQGRITLEVVQAMSPSARCWLADDSAEMIDQQVGGVRVVGREQLAPLANRDDMATIVAIGQTPNRLRVANELAALGLRFANAVHPSAVVSPSARLGVGVLVGPQAAVCSQATVGNHVIVNTGAVVEHDCVLEEGVSLAPGALLTGRVRIGRGAFIGAGAKINPRLTIGAGAIVGAGAVVTRSIEAGQLAYGVPARAIRPVDPARDWTRLL